MSLLLASGPGCETGGGGGGGTIPISQVESQDLEAFCTRLVRCGADPDVDACESAWFYSFQPEYDVTAGKVIYNGDAAARCIAGQESLGCTVSEAAAAAAALTQTCRAIFTGTVANGGACFSDIECVSQSCGVNACNTATCCVGTCQPRVAAGGDCSGNGAVCVDGTVCRLDVNNVATCVTPIAAGQPCAHTATDVCAAGTGCITDPATGSSSCGTAPAEGQPCPDGFCDAEADTCDAITEICVRKVAVGGTCTSSTACVPYAACDLTSSTCVALALAGASCIQDSDCLVGLACASGICTSHPNTPACT